MLSFIGFLSKHGLLYHVNLALREAEEQRVRRSAIASKRTHTRAGGDLSTPRRSSSPKRCARSRRDWFQKTSSSTLVVVSQKNCGGIWGGGQRDWDGQLYGKVSQAFSLLPPRMFWKLSPASRATGSEVVGLGATIWKNIFYREAEQRVGLGHLWVREASVSEN